MRTIKLILALTLIAPFVANAQSVNKSYDTYNFVQAQGGLHMPFTSGDFGDLLQPSWGANVGRWFAPAFGARFGVEGMSSKVKLGEAYDKFKFLNFNVDALFNVLPLINKNYSSKSQLYLIGGIGLNVITDKGSRPSSASSDFAHNLRLGLGYAYQIAKPLTVSLEYRVNNTATYFDGVEGTTDDWYSSLLLGIAYNFGHKTHVVESPALLAPLAAPTLYSQMQAGVDARMNTWMKRLKGESKADYLVRTSDEAIKTQRLEYTKAVATDMAGNRANTNAKDLKYNTQAQLLGVEFTDMPTITLNVPQSEIGTFKTIRDVQFANTIYELNPNDQFEVIYTDAINTSTDKRYNYIRPTDGKQVSTEGYLPLASVHQVMENNIRLQNMTNSAQQEVVGDQEVLRDNTSILIHRDKKRNNDGTYDYIVDYKYTVKDDFSVKDDFAAGKYDVESSNASIAMLNFINGHLNNEFADYLKAGADVHINYHGSADATPINGKIEYNGKYGDIKDQVVTVNGKQKKMTVTKATGITSNEQLSLVRAISVRDYIHKNVSKLKDMKVTESYSVDVSEDEGAKFRRVSVNFIFHDAK